MNKINFREQLAAAKKRANVTNKKMSQETGVREAAISQFLNGKTDIQVGTLEKLLNFLSGTVKVL